MALSARPDNLLQAGATARRQYGDGGWTGVVQQGELESGPRGTGQQVEATLRTAAALTRELKKAKAGAASGQLREMRRALDAASALAGELAAGAERAAGSFDVDDQDYLASGSFTKELLALAAARGVSMFEADDRLLCYPSLIRVLPGDAAVEIDRRREKRLRPSVLVDRLASAQSMPPRFRPEPFLESLEAGYELALAADDKRAGAVVRLVDVWGVLTLLPGQSRDYPRPEFARDLYLLDQSGLTTSKKSKRALRWHASTGSRGSGTLTTVARTGQQQLYWGISFVGAT